jgi:Tol biopolymer transport system component
MATVTETTRLETTRPRIEGYPASGARFDWIAALISGWLVGSLFLDGWAHSHGRVDDVFFTPWHAVLYAGAASMIAFLATTQWRNVNKGYVWRCALPLGYLPSLVGAVLFVLGGGLDLIWHTLFGVEVNIETLLSPTHLVLAAAGTLMITGPIRSAWRLYAPGQRLGWLKLGPTVLCMALLLSVLTFFTNYANPISRMTDSFVKPSAVDASWYSELYTMNADGTGQTRLAHAPGLVAWTGSWSPDGSHIVASVSEISAFNSHEPSGALYIMDVDGSNPHQLTIMDGSEYLPSWSPDGTKIAFISQPNETEQIIYTINVDGSNPQALTENTSQAYMPVWSPDSQQILFTSNHSGTDFIYAMNADGGDMQEIVSQGLYNWGAHWSPDGNKIVFNSYRDGNTDIYTVDLDGANETRLTTDSAHDLMPSWSPDGQYILFSSTQNDVTDIYRVKTDGSDLINISNNPALINQYPNWSPDNSKILYTSNPYSNQTSRYDRENIGVVSVLLQTVLMAAVVILLARRWWLPFGSLSLIFAINALLMAVLSDHYILVLPTLIAGVIGDILLLSLKPSLRTGIHYYSFAFAVPAIYYALFFITVQLTQGIDWSIHLWLGAIVMAGIIGLLVALLMELQNNAAESSHATS